MVRLSYFTSVVTFTSKQTLFAGVTEWIEEQNLRAELGGVVGVIHAVATGLLVAGAKSFTHMITFVERYGTVLDGLLREAGPPVSCPRCTHCRTAQPCHEKVSVAAGGSPLCKQVCAAACMAPSARALAAACPYPGPACC